jgi:rRNA maturation endonuclease Nob1
MGALQNVASFELIDLNIISVDMAAHLMWMRECPRCAACIAKVQSSDAWKCFICGWD